MNAILNGVLKARNGHYCHALEVATSYEIECAIEAISQEFSEESIDTLKDFFNTMDIIYYEENEDGEQIENEENEKEVHDFDINACIDDMLL